jgi:hypothetical protein
VGEEGAEGPFAVLDHDVEGSAERCVREDLVVVIRRRALVSLNVMCRRGSRLGRDWRTGKPGGSVAPDGRAECHSILPGFSPALTGTQKARSEARS